jgi:hypothetical protein
MVFTENTSTVTGSEGPDNAYAGGGMKEESYEIRTMRNMAWERAKGELRSILHTYWRNEESFEKYKEHMERFVSQIENNGWVE